MDLSSYDERLALLRPGNGLQLSATNKHAPGRLLFAGHHGTLGCFFLPIFSEVFRSFSSMSLALLPKAKPERVRIQTSQGCFFVALDTAAVAAVVPCWYDQTPFGLGFGRGATKRCMKKIATRANPRGPAATIWAF